MDFTVVWSPSLMHQLEGPSRYKQVFQMTRRSPFLLLLMLAFQVLAGATHAADVPRLTGLAVLEDPQGSATIDEIARAPDSRFKPLPSGSLAAGYTHSALWLRFSIQAPAGEWWLDVLPPYLDDLRLYVPEPPGSGKFIEHRAGDGLPYGMRELEYRGFVFKLRHHDEAPRTYYLRLKTTSSAIVVPRLWSPDAFYSRSSLELGLLMASLAIMATVLLLNVNALFWQPDPLTPWFLAFLAALSANFVGVTGTGYQYLFPDSPTFNFHFIGVTAFLAIAFGNAFYQRLFKVDRQQPIVLTVYRIAFWLPIAALLLIPLGRFSEAMSWLASTVLPMNLLGTFLAFRLWRRDTAGGGMVLLANLTSMIGIFFVMLNLQGVISGGFAVLHGMQIASLGSILALQLAVGARHREQREASLRAQEEACRAERDLVKEREVRVQQGRFLAMLAHELRTGLSVLSMVVGGEQLPPRKAASAERALKGMNEVIERSLQAERLLDGSLRDARQPCRIAELVGEVVEECRVPGGVHVRLAARPVIVTDEKLLRIILANLIDNALKYGAPDSAVEVSLTTGASPEADACIEVVNLIGPAGVPDGARLFEKYYRSDRAQGVSGSGLGLYLSAHLARLIDVTLRYRCEQGRVIFSLHMPLGQVA